MDSLKTYFLTLNLYSKNGNQNGIDEFQRKNDLFATRLYLISLVVILIGFSLVIGLQIHTRQNTIEKPTQHEFESLNAPICPCSTASISLGSFIRHDPLYHQVCSSDFVSNRWIEAIYFGANSTDYIPNDFRATGSAIFQALASFCELAKEKLAESISSFNSTSMVSPRALSRSDLTSQVAAIMNDFQRRAPNLFKTQIQLISQIIQANQMYNGLSTCIILSIRYRNNRYDKTTDIIAYVHEDGSWCGCVLSTSCQEPSGIFNQYNINLFGTILSEYRPNLTIPGIVIGLVPVDTLLQSSLECFYNITCLARLVTYSNRPNQSFNALNPNLKSRFSMNLTVQSLIDQLLVESLRSVVSFEHYYDICSPLSCVYITHERIDILNVFTTLIGLLGGLCTILAIGSIYVVNFLRRQPQPRQNQTLTLKQRLLQFKEKMKTTINQLNLFEEESDHIHAANMQRIVTRLYIIVLIVAITILLSYTSLTIEIRQVEMKYPTLAEYESVRLQYSSSLQCPCSSISMKNSRFLTITPIYHQVCLSDFISNAWIAYANEGLMGSRHFCKGDYRAFGGNFFKLLQNFCQQAQQILNDSLEIFLSADLVSSQVIPLELFISDVNMSIRDWESETIRSFNRTFQMIQALYATDSLVNSYDNFLIDFNATLDLSTLPPVYIDKRNNATCDCAIAKSCRQPLRFYNDDEFNQTCDILSDLPSLYMDCSPIQGILESTLECFYNETCLNVIYFYWPLGNRSFTRLNSNRNKIDEKIDSLVSRLFVDTWSINITYDKYYDACSPETCTYQLTDRRDFRTILAAVISIFGGLNLILKIIFKIVLKILEIVLLNANNHQVWSALKRWIISWKQRRYLKNRLSVVVLCITIVVLFMFSAFRKETKMIQIQDPSTKTYYYLLENYPESLRCECSKYSICYDTFLNVSVYEYHQVCSSDLVSDLIFFNDDLSKSYQEFNRNDFKLIFSVFLKILRSMCDLTKEAVSNGIIRLIGDELMTSQLLSPTSFNDQIHSIVNEFFISTGETFYNTLHLIRRMTGDNTLMTVRQTNWRWRELPDEIGSSYTTLGTTPIQYGSCDCGLSARCTQPVMSSSNRTGRGLHVGCYPIEALLKSTLECFYDYSCYQPFLFTNISMTPLDPLRKSVYHLNATVDFIVRQLMVEKWFISTSYQNYFDQCRPSYCSYFYNDYYSRIDVATTLIGLYGGLAILTQIMVHFLVKILPVMEHNPNNVVPIDSQ